MLLGDAIIVLSFTFVKGCEPFHSVVAILFAFIVTEAPLQIVKVSGKINSLVHSGSFRFAFCDVPMLCPLAPAITGTPLASTAPFNISPFKSLRLKTAPPSIASKQTSPSLSGSKWFATPSPSVSQLAVDEMITLSKAWWLPKTKRII